MKNENKKSEKMRTSPKTNTMVKPSSATKKSTGKNDGGVSWTEVEEAVIMINPDVESMESRG